MNELRLLALEERLRRTEEELNRLRRRRLAPVGTGFIALLAAVGFWLSATGAARSDPAAPDSRPIHSVQAPFEVQGSGGKTIVRVEDTPAPCLWVFGQQGSVRLVINEYGGAVSIRSGGGVMAQSPTSMFYNSNGQGVISVNDKTGLPLAQLSAEGASAFSNGRMVARLGTSTRGTGYLSIGNSNGDAVVEAGDLDGRGIVRAYPYKPRTGEILTGSNFIIGAKK